MQQNVHNITHSRPRSRRMREDSGRRLTNQPGLLKYVCWECTVVTVILRGAPPPRPRKTHRTWPVRTEIVGLGQSQRGLYRFCYHFPSKTHSKAISLARVHTRQTTPFCPAFSLQMYPPPRSHCNHMPQQLVILIFTVVNVSGWKCISMARIYSTALSPLAGVFSWLWQNAICRADVSVWAACLIKNFRLRSTSNFTQPRLHTIRICIHGLGVYTYLNCTRAAASPRKNDDMRRYNVEFFWRHYFRFFSSLSIFLGFVCMPLWSSPSFFLAPQRGAHLLLTLVSFTWGFCL